ncbi:MAG: hypothetical protein E7070_10430 [Bacteroidales bacterium]|jgi:Fe2+ or Zn2+ uptake regulation protein|nr:hypothetical protein [Bacteroidales bacterium]
MKKHEETQQRRDKIVRNLKVKPELGQGLRQAQDILNDYLKERGMNQTPERSYILWVIYHLDVPFDVDSLHKLVCEEKAMICRVTVYNNLLLFVEAGVVARFQPFVNGSQFFEKCIGQKPHGYQVCRRCGAIKVLQMSDIIEPISNQVASSFHTSQVCMYVLGLCNSCFKEERHDVRLRQMAMKLEREKRAKNRQEKTEVRRRKRYTSIKDVKLDQELQALKEKKNKK